MAEQDRVKLLEEYAQKKTAELREQLIIEYSRLVKMVAGRMAIYLGYNVEYDDLVSYGIFGLIDAIDKYDFAQNTKFETYASFRIRGAMLDQIRKMDWIPRSIRQKQKKIDAAISKIESETGDVATDEQIAAELNITVDELDNWNGQTKATNLISLDEYIEQGSEIEADTTHNSHYAQPEHIIEKTELKQMLTEAISELTDKEKSVVIFYYYEDLTLKEISKVLDVTESRVSQLHTKAIQKMRKKMGNYLDLLIQ